MFSEPGLKHVVWKNKDVKMNMAGNLIETLDVNNENQALYICTTSDFPVEQIEDYVPVGDHNALERLQLVRCFYLSEIIECFDLFEEAKYVVIQDLEAVYKLGLARNYSEGMLV
ncbi:unnamed protein product [Kuraishia capsulata CBS 1993]|uniref:Uncharacterized protein n=1 Tax=Kuraishia capsulata CBS 1993 TaxID=1382522 RepID=W6MV78_9ASCO|nr:uncharacterized protein KUCA_T00002091001 [Kuraishia capsulata CBS 1993]CDK26120.1 unnamed protein product [Kuraishia capsulata CBS 1993]